MTDPDLPVGGAPRMEDHCPTDTPQDGTLPRDTASLLATPLGVMRAASALMKYGAYEEDEDSLEWLRREAADVAAAVEAGESVVAVLIDTAFIDEADPESVAAGYAVAHELGVAS